jgi:hypothetical protein
MTRMEAELARTQEALSRAEREADLLMRRESSSPASPLVDQPSAFQDSSVLWPLDAPSPDYSSSLTALKAFNQADIPNQPDKNREQPPGPRPYPPRQDSPTKSPFEIAFRAPDPPAGAGAPDRSQPRPDESPWAVPPTGSAPDRPPSDPPEIPIPPVRVPGHAQLPSVRGRPPTTETPSDYLPPPPPWAHPTPDLPVSGVPAPLEEQDDEPTAPSPPPSAIGRAFAGEARRYPGQQPPTNQDTDRPIRDPEQARSEGWTEHRNLAAVIHAARESVHDLRLHLGWSRRQLKDLMVEESTARNPGGPTARQDEYEQDRDRGTTP